MEWRYWVGREVAEVSGRGMRQPRAVHRKGAEAIAAIARHADHAGFEIREGIRAHDTAAMDTLRLPAAHTPFTPNRPAARPGGHGGQR